ncbi:MAG: DUF2167 domain-containing protein [Allosphingosinicella sp.]
MTFRLLALALVAWLASPAAAQKQPPAQPPAQAPAQATAAARTEAELNAAWAAAAKTAISGPAEVPLAGQARLKLPADEAFVPAAEANRIMAALGNSRSASRQGLIVGKAKDAGWLVDVDWIQEGYVKDDEARDWKADEMLQGLKEGTEAQNATRLAQGIPAIDVTGWVEPPAYDAAAHRLVWSLSLKDRGAADDVPQTVNYNTYALGRDGYFSLDLISGTDTIAADKKVARDLLAGLAYVPGKKYEDFNASTDKVAAYGLGALIGVVAAKKLGLLAMAGLFLLKAWKLLLLGLAAVGAGARRFFGRRSREEEAGAYEAAAHETPAYETPAYEPDAHALDVPAAGTAEARA